MYVATLSTYIYNSKAHSLLYVFNTLDGNKLIHLLKYLINVCIKMNMCISSMRVSVHT